MSDAQASISVPSTVKCSWLSKRGCRLLHDAKEELLGDVCFDQSLSVLRERARIEAGLGHVHVEEPAEEQVVVKLLAELALTLDGRCSTSKVDPAQSTTARSIRRSRGAQSIGMPALRSAFHATRVPHPWLSVHCRLGALSMLGLLQLACSKHAPSPTSAMTGLRAVDARTCAPPIANAEVRFAYAEGDACVALVDADLSPTSSTPVIFHRQDGVFRQLSLPGDPDEQNNHGWVAAAANGRDLVAVLDYRVESPGWELSVMFSSDGGRTFRRSAALQKPYYFATVTGLAFEPSGRVTIHLELDDDYGAGLTPGRYRIVSLDRGQSWADAEWVASLE